MKRGVKYVDIFLSNYMLQNFHCKFCTVTGNIGEMSLQSRRFRCKVQVEAVTSLVTQLKFDSGISYCAWNEEGEVYIETKVKKTVTYFNKGYPLLSEISPCKEVTVPSSHAKGAFGKAFVVKQIQNMNCDKMGELAEVYEYAKENGESPDMTGNILAMLHRSDYYKVINEGTKESTKRNISILN